MMKVIGFLTVLLLVWMTSVASAQEDLLRGMWSLTPGIKFSPTPELGEKWIIMENYFGKFSA